MKSKSLVFAVALVLSTPALSTGVPVIDVANLAQTVQQVVTMGEQLTALKEQLDTARSALTSLQEQAKTMADMYTDLSGISNHARMLTNPVQLLHSYIPAELLDPAAAVKGQLGGLVGELRAAGEKYTAQQLFPAANQAQMREQYEKAAEYAFSYKAYAKATYDAFAERRDALESLSTATTTATTPGSKLDLIAKAIGENSLLLNDIAQMLSLQISAEADRAILEHNRQGLLATQASKPTQN
jgi:type IV secretion system protein VirB5